MTNRINIPVKIMWWFYPVCAIIPKYEVLPNVAKTPLRLDEILHFVQNDNVVIFFYTKSKSLSLKAIFPVSVTLNVRS